MLTKHEIDILKERIRIEDVKITIAKRDEDNNSSLQNSFGTWRFQNTIRVVIDDRIVTVSGDDGKVKVHISPLDGAYKTDTIEPQAMGE